MLTDADKGNVKKLCKIILLLFSKVEIGSATVQELVTEIKSNVTDQDMQRIKAFVMQNIFMLMGSFTQNNK